MTALWEAEHGAEYAVPDVIANAEHAEDHSWHNDTSPKFGQYLTFANDPHNSVEVMLWVEHPDPAKREYSTEVRFNITVNCDAAYHADRLKRAGIPDPDLGAEQSVWEGNDPAEAIDKLYDTIDRVQDILQSSPPPRY